MEYKRGQETEDGRGQSWESRR